MMDFGEKFMKDHAMDSTQLCTRQQQHLQSLLYKHSRATQATVGRYTRRYVNDF